MVSLSAQDMDDAPPPLRADDAEADLQASVRHFRETDTCFMSPIWPSLTGLSLRGRPDHDLPDFHAGRLTDGIGDRFCNGLRRHRDRSARRNALPQRFVANVVRKARGREPRHQRRDARRLTSLPSLKTDLQNAGADWVDQEVVVDGGLVTSRKPDDIPAFNRAVISLLAGVSEQSHQVAAK